MRDTSPSSRVEGYREDVLDKLRWVADLEKKVKADAVIWAGDVFHYPAPSKTSHATVLRMLEVVELYNNLYVVPGNHDLSADRLDSMTEKQPLGVLLHGGLKVLDGWDKDLPIYGVPWQQDWIVNERRPAEAFKAFRQGIEEGRYPANSLAVTHAPIYPPEEQQSTIFELLPTRGKDSVADAMGGQGALYYGHIHEDHGVFEDGGVTYCNVGALSRGSLHEYNIERDIQVAIWDSEKGFIPIKVPTKKAEDLFYLEEHQESITDKKDLNEFLEDVGQSQIAISSVESVKNFIHDQKDLDKKIKDKAVEILDLVS